VDQAHILEHWCDYGGFLWDDCDDGLPTDKVLLRCLVPVSMRTRPQRRGVAAVDDVVQCPAEGRGAGSCFLLTRRRPLARTW
jgi:hypothetical protein